MLALPGFSQGPQRLGMELEMSLVDDAGRPLLRNDDVLAAYRGERLDVELNRFNVEYNSVPVLLTGAPFSALGADMRAALTETSRAAATCGGHVVMAGILPTLREGDLQSDALTDRPRFRALSERIRQVRQAPFRVYVDGRESVDITCDDVTLEGANTSLQVHLQTTPGDFARVFNAAQIGTGPVLALCGNSPFLCGRLGWEETRVALFRQAVDDREPTGAWRPARVSFGHGWARAGAHELFAETVALHAPLLPVCGDDDPAAEVAAGQLPQLSDLRLHHGTVWRWNRAIYDPGDGGSLRLEMRALPAGPTVADMTANAALLVGVTEAIAEETDWMVAALPFRYAEYNFIEAARRGLDATFLWPARRAPSPRPVAARDLLARLIDAADVGLESAGVAADERERQLSVLRGRLRSGQTGSVWQRNAVAAHEPKLGRERALARMLEAYMELSYGGEPVHTWPPDAPS